jgi:hypothetical protein
MLSDFGPVAAILHHPMQLQGSLFDVVRSWILTAPLIYTFDMHLVLYPVMEKEDRGTPLWTRIGVYRDRKVIW